ncbi:MAG: anhydro-N-acetylmuramic acid kinase [Planctomycetaceae bacterium]|nr:anhydro-N-acetylmuramic acid kinase [Planctomycetaceae bacterium]
MIAVGLMSGTSADGVSLAAIRIDRGLKFLAYRTFPYPRALRERILAARHCRTPELSALHGDLGRYFGRCAKTFIGRSRPQVIGSHGQTVWHEPGRHSLQIGEAAHIAEATGVPTVCDFRAADIAAGGQGAPLVPYFDRALFGVRNAATLNLGGIANVTILTKDPAGFDTGPGNCLIDEAMRIAYGKPRDTGGRVAATGKIDRALLARLDDPWLRRPPPKSTGRERFSREFLLDRCGAALKRKPADVIATLTLFTAKTVGEAIARFVRKPLQEVIVSGGGMLNRTLMAQLEWTLWPAVPRPVTVYGVHPLAKEPAAFALLAAETLRGRPGNLPSVTGARRPVVLGKLLR